MNARITAICGAIAFTGVMGVFAQEPSTSPTSQSTSAKTITVTGCVQPAQQGPTGTSGTAGATPSAAQTKFVLTSASPATAIASEYRLDTEDAKLTPHIGHKVEITGTVEQPARTEQKPPASAANAPTLKVDNVKMIASTCP